MGAGGVGGMLGRNLLGAGLGMLQRFLPLPLQGFASMLTSSVFRGIFQGGNILRNILHNFGGSLLGGIGNSISNFLSGSAIGNFFAGGFRNMFSTLAQGIAGGGLRLGNVLGSFLQGAVNPELIGGMFQGMGMLGDLGRNFLSHSLNSLVNGQNPFSGQALRSILGSAASGLLSSVTTPLLDGLKSAFSSISEGFERMMSPIVDRLVSAVPQSLVHAITNGGRIPPINFGALLLDGVNEGVNNSLAHFADHLSNMRLESLPIAGDADVAQMFHRFASSSAAIAGGSLADATVPFLQNDGVFGSYTTDSQGGRHATVVLRPSSAIDTRWNNLVNRGRFQMPQGLQGGGGGSQMFDTVRFIGDALTMQDPASRYQLLASNLAKSSSFFTVDDAVAPHRALVNQSGTSRIISALPRGAAAHSSTFRGGDSSGRSTSNGSSGSSGSSGSGSGGAYVGSTRTDFCSIHLPPASALRKRLTQSTAISEAAAGRFQQTAVAAVIQGFRSADERSAFCKAHIPPAAFMAEGMTADGEMCLVIDVMPLLSQISALRKAVSAFKHIHMRIEAPVVPFLNASRRSTTTTTTTTSSAATAAGSSAATPHRMQTELSLELDMLTSLLESNATTGPWHIVAVLGSVRDQSATIRALTEKLGYTYSRVWFDQLVPCGMWAFVCTADRILFLQPDMTQLRTIATAVSISSEILLPYEREIDSSHLTLLMHAMPLVLCEGRCNSKNPFATQCALARRSGRSVSLSFSGSASSSPSTSVSRSSSSSASDSISGSVSMLRSVSGSGSFSLSGIVSLTTTMTITLTSSPTNSYSQSSSASYTTTVSPSNSETFSATASWSPSVSPSKSPSPSSTPSATLSPSDSSTPTFSRSMTPSYSWSRTTTRSSSPTISMSPTGTPSPSKRTPSRTPSPSRSLSATPSLSSSVSLSFTPTPSFSPSRTSSLTPTPSRTFTPTASLPTTPSRRSATVTITVNATPSDSADTQTFPATQTVVQSVTASALALSSSYSKNVSVTITRTTTVSGGPPTATLQPPQTSSRTATLTASLVRQAKTRSMSLSASLSDSPSITCTLSLSPAMTFTPPPASATDISNNVEVTKLVFNGTSWLQMLASNETLVRSYLISAIATALGIPEASVHIVSLTIGSLVAIIAIDQNIFFTDPATGGSASITLSSVDILDALANQTDFSNLTTLYRDVTGDERGGAFTSVVSISASLTSSSLLQSVCDVDCQVAIGLAVGISSLFAVLAVALFWGSCTSKKLPQPKKTVDQQKKASPDVLTSSKEPFFGDEGPPPGLWSKKKAAVRRRRLPSSYHRPCEGEVENDHWEFLPLDLAATEQQRQVGGGSSEEAPRWSPREEERRSSATKSSTTTISIWSTIDGGAQAVADRNGHREPFFEEEAPPSANAEQRSVASSTFEEVEASQIDWEETTTTATGSNLSSYGSTHSLSSLLVTMRRRRHPPVVCHGGGDDCGDQKTKKEGGEFHHSPEERHPFGERSSSNRRAAFSAREPVDEPARTRSPFGHH